MIFSWAGGRNADGVQRGYRPGGYGRRSSAPAACRRIRLRRSTYWNGTVDTSLFWQSIFLRQAPRRHLRVRREDRFAQVDVQHRPLRRPEGERDLGGQERKLGKPAEAGNLDLRRDRPEARRSSTSPPATPHLTSARTIGKQSLDTDAVIALHLRTGKPAKPGLPGRSSRPAGTTYRACAAGALGSRSQRKARRGSHARSARAATSTT